MALKRGLMFERKCSSSTRTEYKHKIKSALYHTTCPVWKFTVLTSQLSFIRTSKYIFIYIYHTSKIYKCHQKHRNRLNIQNRKLLYTRQNKGWLINHIDFNIHVEFPVHNIAQQHDYDAAMKLRFLLKPFSVVATFSQLNGGVLLPHDARQRANVAQVRRESSWLRHSCVTCVEFSLITFALSCFVSDALSRCFPPHEACFLHSAQLLLRRMTAPRRRPFTAERASSQGASAFVRPTAPHRSRPAAVPSAPEGSPRDDLLLLRLCWITLNGIRGWPEVSTATVHPPASLL